MPWLETHEPWIDWRCKAIGANRPTVFNRALVVMFPHLFGTGAPEMVAKALTRPKKYWELLGVADSYADVAMSLATGRETKAHCQACGIAATASPNAESRRAVRASTVAVPDGTDQTGNIGLQAAEAAEENAKGVSCMGNIGPQVGNIGPQAGNVVPQAAEAAKEDAESASSVSNIDPRRVEETEKKNESAACVSSVGNEVSRGVKKTSTRAEVSLSISRVDNKIPHSETPPARPVEEQYHQVKAGAVHLEALPEVSALLNLEKLSMKDFLAGLKAGEIADMVLLKPETSPGDLNSSLVMDEDVLEGFTKHRATRLGSGNPNPRTRRQPSVFVNRTGSGVWFMLIGVASDVTGVIASPSDVQSLGHTTPLKHLRRVFEVMRANKLYANVDKCVFAADEIKVLGCFVSRVGVRADPGKVKAIAASPTPRSQKDLRKWLGLANYLHKYSAGYAELARPLSDLLKKDADWVLEQQHQDAFDSIKASLQQAPVLALPDENKSFSVVCDASDYAIGCALLQKDDEGHEPQAAESCLAAKRNYPVHDKELLAMKYALVKFRVHLLGSRPFVIYTDHASLRTATNSPHLSQQMARWLSFFAEYNFRVEYKPGKLNVLADALSRRPDYELAHNYTPLVQFLSDGKDAKVDRLSPRQRAQLHRCELTDGLLHYRVDLRDPPRVVVPNDEDLKYDILPEAHDVPISGHLGREKTYQMVSQTFWWPRMYKWVAHYVKTCETCQRVKPSGHGSAPLQNLPVPADCWKSMSLDFVFGLPADDKGNTGILVFVCRLSKMVHLAPIACFAKTRYHGLPESIVSDRDPRFTGAFWDTLFQLLGTKLTMSTADHPQTDDQMEHVNRVLQDALRSICAEVPRSWSDQLPMVEFALNNAVHASTGFTPFYLNGLRHPRLTLISRARNAMASAQDKQKEYSDKHR
ncbi:Pol protein [Phytophthora palmivora]|uniref:Pol protein n=1 Tax=Phytophthora palmivora TaxID=4796 RepID=A0A2P4YSF3_9STRA|nr:Pol protein [Phytophthora palmivora]